ncbi:TraR/DksA C4-type zinc finger protein [Gracilibacillus sp. HCP3S3_G5_1]|uniref:TraR/DksA C4-type zinc finger protein n=1 Tax=unclassified Gracilibacillus TaxID=2625209 RepID=UPI003F887942
MNPEVIDQCKQLLKERKKQLLSEQLYKDNSLEEEVEELTTFDNHPADMGTELFERQKDITLNQQIQEELLEIDHALEAIENGTYHICEKCGRTIKEERLLAIPATRYCVDHGK